MAPTTDSFADLTGTTIGDGRYLLLSTLGAGSYGRVYKALDKYSPPDTRAYYAIKCLLKPHPGSREEIFQTREFTLHKLISDACLPNIVRFHHHFEEDDSDYIFVVLDLCDGGDLFTAITEERRFSGKDGDEEVKRVFVKILDAVHACHRAGVFHRDLKPENILCGKDGEVRVCDFGLATQTRVSREFKCGSGNYMSPECINEDNTHTRYSTSHNDIWALGVILTNMISCRHPWRKAVSTDQAFVSYNSDRDFFRRTFFISDAANKLLRRIFNLNPLCRIPLTELRKAVLEIDTFFATDNDPPLVSLAPQIVVDSGSRSHSYSSASSESHGPITPPSPAIHPPVEVPALALSEGEGARHVGELLQVQVPVKAIVHDRPRSPALEQAQEQQKRFSLAPSSAAVAVSLGRLGPSGADQPPPRRRRMTPVSMRLRGWFGGVAGA